MNYSTAVMLINDNIKAVRCCYKPEDEKSPHLFTTFKTLDPSLAVGDLVVVPSGTRYDRTVVKVMELDVEVDFDSSKKMDWIVGKLEQAVFDNIVAEEGKAIEAIKQAEKAKRKRDIRDNMLALQAENLQNLPIANMTGNSTQALADHSVSGANADAA